MTMAREVEKLRAELVNTSNIDRRTGMLLFTFISLSFRLLAMSPLTSYDIVDDSIVATNAGGPYGGTPGSNENEASGHPVGQHVYEDGYSVPQVCNFHLFGCNNSMLYVIHIIVKRIEEYGNRS